MPKRQSNQRWKEEYVTRPKRDAAIARQEAYDKFTVAEKLAKLDAGGFAAVKQRARLQLVVATNQSDGFDSEDAANVTLEASKPKKKARKKKTV